MLGYHIVMKKIFAIIALITIVVLWGTSFVVSKDVLDNSPPAFVIMCRGVITVIVLLPFCIGKIKSLGTKYIVLALVTGAVVALAYITQIVGLQYTTPAKCGFYENAYCIVVPFCVWICQHKRPLPKSWLTMALCVVGIIIIGCDFGNFSVNIGDVLCVVGGALFGVNIALTGVFAKDVNPIAYTFVQFVAVTTVSGLYTAVFEHAVPNFANAGFVWTLLYMCVFVTALAWILRNFAQQNLSPLTLSVVLPFSSVISLFLSVAMGRDVFTPRLVIGAILMVIAVIIDGVFPLNKTAVQQVQN